MMGTMLLLTLAAACVGLSIQAGVIVFYLGAGLMGIAQAIVYPTLTTYLSFVLPQTNRNVLIGLFIATADLGVSLGVSLWGRLLICFLFLDVFDLCRTWRTDDYFCV